MPSKCTENPELNWDLPNIDQVLLLLTTVKPKEMRNINTLLTVSLLWLHKYRRERVPISGLCLLFFLMLERRIITKDEYTELHRYLGKNHSPTKLRYDGFYWEKYLFIPRVEWLNKHIKLTKLQELQERKSNPCYTCTDDTCVYCGL